jgi:hypothetical protein
MFNLQSTVSKYYYYPFTCTPEWSLPNHAIAYPKWCKTQPCPAGGRG